MRRTVQLGHHPFADTNEQYGDVIQLWALRMLVELHGYRRLVLTHGMLSIDGDAVLQAAGLGHILDSDGDLKLEIVRKAAQKELQRLEARGPRLQKGPLTQNTAWLQESLGLSSVEVEILRFMVLVNAVHELKESTETLGNLDQGRLQRALAVVLDLSPEQTYAALSAGSTLIESGLVGFDVDLPCVLDRKLKIVRGLTDAMLAHHPDPAQVFATMFQKSPDCRLTRADYPHIAADYELLTNYLRDAVERGTKGVNILIFGPPGTGKTELARLIANERGLSLHEIATTYRDCEAMMPDDRLSAYRISQSLLARRKDCAILFDEIEDIFPDRGDLLLGNKTLRTGKKAWINKLLEQNEVPAFWVSNSVSQIDRAFLRRFDYVLELGLPPRSVRKGVLEKHLTDLPVREACIERMAGNAYLTPATIERAAKIVAHLQHAEPPQVEGALERVIGNTLEVMGLPRQTNDYPPSVTDYSLRFLNPDVDLEQLAQGLRRNPTARLCLYGPPGTGKTGFGHYLANELDKPLLKMHASTLLNKYVGGTEKNLLRMFRLAKYEDAVLLLDEADSFLQDRTGATHRWEVSLVNELLVQMESFDGVFIASTNLMDSLDPACLRRFDFKIRFDYLDPDGAWEIFRQVLKDHGHRIGKPATWRRRLQALTNLTPGDFANAVRQYRLSKEPMDANRLFAALEKECLAKPGVSRRAIGFLAKH